ncbi:MAG: phosphate starvation-inducible protein PhoH [Deltaproteobacteria bacterium]|nr:PhoH family protein [Deltaproteobacteria bacterium]MBW2076228.1 PhoH family protein [Deltaproteobacteria bacterium]RLB30420.1 MAG: phosphate starvation-inducible protein PhoH [Deltaproteobacteria bacterium]
MDGKRVTFDDNELARSLFGERNGNLQLIEKALNIAINIRGNDLMLQGEPPELEMAENLLNQLYGLIKEGYPIYQRDVDYSIRILGGDHKAQLKPIFLDRVYIPSKKRTITPKSINQKIYIDSIRENDIVFGIGPAGTGKTYLAMAMAISSLMKKEIDRVVLARPAVEAGEKLGFLPGDLYEKVNPYLRPLYDALHDMMDFESGSRLLQRGVIEVAPLAFMRGRTLNDSFIILDEAQNSTPEQMKMFLTRLGFSSKTVITGDITQIDLPDGKSSGLIQARDLLSRIKGIKFIYFGREDVVRHPLVQEIIDAYDKVEA